MYIHDIFDLAGVCFGIKIAVISLAEGDMTAIL